MAESIEVLFSPDLLFTEEGLDPSGLPHYCSIDPAFLIRWVHYCNFRRLGDPIRTSPQRSSPASLIHLATEAFRRTIMSIEWNRVTAAMRESGEMLDVRESEAHQRVLSLLDLTESDIRVMAGLPP